MNIFSKQMLYAGAGNSELFEVYRVEEGQMTSLGTVKNIESTYFCESAIESFSYFLNGTFYCISKTGLLITHSNVKKASALLQNRFFGYNGTKWGYGTDEGSRLNIYFSDTLPNVKKMVTEKNNLLIIMNDAGLYDVNNTQISTITSWSKITGFLDYDASYYGYGIADGKLYYIYGDSSGVIQQGNDTTWTNITGTCGYVSKALPHCYGYGINNGKLYKLDGTPTQIGSNTTWSDISGATTSLPSSGTGFCAMGIDNGKLYILDETLTQVGSATNWLKCSGSIPRDTNNGYVLAYTDTALYGIYYDGTTTKIMDGEWVYCDCVCIKSATQPKFGIAIRRITND